MLASVLRRLLEFLGANDYVYFTFNNRVFKPTQRIIHLQNSIVIELDEVE